MCKKNWTILMEFSHHKLTGPILPGITQTCPCNILQYFTAVKSDNFQTKFFDFDIFLIFAQNIDCWYTLEPPQ